MRPRRPIADALSRVVDPEVARHIVEPRRRRDGTTDRDRGTATIAYAIAGVRALAARLSPFLPARKRLRSARPLGAAVCRLAGSALSARADVARARDAVRLHPRGGRGLSADGRPQLVEPTHALGRTAGGAGD